MVNLGNVVIAITVQSSLVLYLAAVLCGLSRSDRWGPWYRPLWLAASLMMGIHAAVAFHFYHHWSHSAAVADTAEQTREMMGVAFGEGIWFSYALLVIWLLDALANYWFRERRLWVVIPVHLYVFFILFNGTVTFKTGLIRGLGIVGSILIILAIVRYGLLHLFGQSDRQTAESVPSVRE